MQIKMRNLAVLAACFLGFAAAARAQVSGIEGIVKDADGKPIANAIVKIERQDIRGNYTVKTDKKGHYGHYGLPLGTYNITVEVDGKPVDKHKRCTHPAGRSVATAVQLAAGTGSGGPNSKHRLRRRTAV